MPEATKLVTAIDFAIKSSKAKASTLKQYDRLLANADPELLLTPVHELKYGGVRMAILRDLERHTEKVVFARYSCLKSQLRRLDRLGLYTFADRRIIEADWEIRKPKRPPVRRIGTEVIKQLVKDDTLWSWVFLLGVTTSLR